MTLLAASLVLFALGGDEAPPGTAGGGGLALRAAKVLTCAHEGPAVVYDAVLLVEDGKIRALGPADELEIPEGYSVQDLGARWLAPGMVDLHSHVGGTRRDINDMVLQVNPGLSTAPTVIPDNDALQVPLSTGVTTILYIPGSGTNIGGQGVLMKLGEELYEDALVRDPGSLKIAQGDNPTRWGYRMGRVLMNYHLRHVIRRGRAYAMGWQEFEAGDEAETFRPEPPVRDLALDVFRDLYGGHTQVSTHTQYYQLVLMTITMLARDYGLPTYIDHGSFDSYKTTPEALKYGVAAILGPREVMVPGPPRFDTDGRIIGTAWGFEQAGHDTIGFNTDAPVVPQEELFLQASMGVRYGLSNDRGQGLRGVTIVPARTAGIAHRVGSLEVGKDADVIVVSGDPLDPRTVLDRTYVNGRLVYDAERDGRRW